MNIATSRLLLVGLACIACAAEEGLGQRRGSAPPEGGHLDHGEATTGRHDPAAVHGMVLFGRDAQFLSHLPLFHPPHDYQVLLEAELRGMRADGPAAGASAGERASGAASLYTVVPERFSLPAVLAPRAGMTADGAAPPRFRFRSRLVRGHFERGGVTVASEVEIEVVRVLHFRPLHGDHERPERLTYLLFGRGDELYLAHYIARPPDFDQIVAVSAPPGALAGVDLSRAAVVTVPTRPEGTPVEVGELVSVEVPGVPALVPLRIEREHYREFGDLAR